MIRRFLDGGKTGLNAYNEIAANVKKHLKLGGVICLEMVWSKELC